MLLIKKIQNLRILKFSILLISVFLLPRLSLKGQIRNLRTEIEIASRNLEPDVISWRRDFHQHPELGNREIRTSEVIAKRLRSFGIDVITEVGKTGVVGILRGYQKGPVVALRADMDALPIEEPPGLPFVSKVKAQFNGQDVSVMHACGHDAHMAMLLGVAKILSSLKDDLKGTIKFIFQPAEEGPPVGEEGGAKLMIKEGVLSNPEVDAIFGMHMMPNLEIGKVAYRSGGIEASINDFQIIVKGKGAHGAFPWLSIDPIVASAQIVSGLQTIVSRNLDITKSPGVVTVGAINGGNRSNIIPDKVELLGTIRALNTKDEEMIIQRVREIASKIAASTGAEADIKIPYSMHYPVTYNDPELTEHMITSLEKTLGKKNVVLHEPITGGEDFSFYAERIPGFYVFLGGMPKAENTDEAPALHTSKFYIDEGSFRFGMLVMANLAIDYLNKDDK